MYNIIYIYQFIRKNNFKMSIMFLILFLKVFFNIFL